MKKKEAQAEEQIKTKWVFLFHQYELKSTLHVHRMDPCLSGQQSTTEIMGCINIYIEVVVHSNVKMSILFSIVSNNYLFLWCIVFHKRK